ncbi:MAG: hypothetical protein J7L15_07330 [Clostridiales bacterium]|nr:hypothetical protein [Clostridiales bacterium]
MSMLLQHQIDPCDITDSIYATDEIFQMVVKNLTPEVIFNANAELIQAFTQAVVNYSPISVNIIDYWNKSNNKYDYIYKPTPPPIKENEPVIPKVPCFSFFGSDDIHKGFANFADYAVGIPTNQPTGIDPYSVIEPLLDEEGNPVLDEEGNPVLQTIPNAGLFGRCSLYDKFEKPKDDCGFYLNETIGLKDKLAEIFMHNVYSITSNAKHNYVFRSRLKATLTKAGIQDAAILDDINDLFTEDRFIINGTWREKKGTEIAMKYSAKQAIDSHLQPIELQVPFKWDITSVDPMTYTVEGSLLPSIFEVFVRPLSHPISYIYEYKMVCEEIITDYIMANKFESASSISVITLCDSDLEPCCNPLNNLDEKDLNGNLVHPYPANPEYRGQTGRPPYPNEETFSCLSNSTGQYGRHFKIAIGSQCDSMDCVNGTASEDCELWDKLDCEEGLRDFPNVLKSTEEGISKDEKYYLWTYKKYVLQNLNYIVKYSKPDDLTSAAETVIEYWRNGPIGYYPYAIWYNDWQADINITDYKVWYKSELSDEVEALTHKGRADVSGPINGARWFGFNDDTDTTVAQYPDIYTELIPEGWEYFGSVPPGTDPNEDCPTDVESVFKCDVKLPNKGFANLPTYIEVDKLDPLYLAGNFLGHPVNVRCVTNLEITIDPVLI